MKILAGIFTLAMSFTALASTLDTKTFYYDGSVNSVELILNAEKTHTETRYENRRTTCFRQEVGGYRTVCTGGYPGSYPNPYPGPYYPTPYPHRNPGHCWSEPVYRTVPYSCVQTVGIPYEVKDYDVTARVIIDVTNLSSDITPGETFKVSLYGDVLSYDVVGSKKFFVVKKKQDVRTTANGSVRMLDGLLAAELIEAAPVLDAIKMTNIAINDGVLNFNIGPVSSTENLGVDLKVVKVKTFGSNTVLLNRELREGEITFAPTADGSIASVDVNRLGVELTGGKYNLTAKAFAKFNGSLMNSSQFSELSASRTLIYKIR